MTDPALVSRVASATWYHTIDLGGGLVTPGIYDHRPYLHHYGLPEDLAGWSALDVGAASGFFSFELERRGARVTATDLPAWFAHDFAPTYVPDQSEESGRAYLLEPFEIARAALGSRVERRLLNIYDVSPETVGQHDLVFCGSVLVHLTDPIKALWRLASVCRRLAVVATVITPGDGPAQARLDPWAGGEIWWLPNRRGLELMALSAGFSGIRWVDEFRLDLRDGRPGPYHGVLHAYKGTEGWAPGTLGRDEALARLRADGAEGQSVQLAALEAEVARLHDLVARYERGRFIRATRWLRERLPFG